MARKKVERESVDAPPKPGPLSEPVMHKNITLVETADAEEMDFLLASDELNLFLVRIAPTAAAALPKHADQILEAMKKLGHAPKIREAAYEAL